MRKGNNFRLLPIAAALLVVYGNARAQDADEVQALITPESSVSLGVGNVNSNNDAKRFGEYRGTNKEGAYGLIDLSVIKRDEATGTWMILQGRDLGLDTQELGFTHQKQGDWKYTIDYNEIVRHDPYTIHTGMTGVGTATPTINLINKPAMPAAWVTANGLAADNGVVGSDLELKLKRTALGISAEKWISPEWLVEGGFRTEEKKGARMFGRAGLDSSDMSIRPTNNVANANGSWAVLLTPEPINSTTNIFEAKLSYNKDKLALTGGYNASFYNNNFGSLSPSVSSPLNRGALWSGNSPPASSVAQLASAPVALPPDNQAHQLYMSGTYGYSNATRINFKLAYTHATQNDSFTGQGLTPATGAPADLGGEVNTTLAQVSMTSRASKDLTFNASLRYEDRADKTPVYVYNTNGTAGSPLNNSTNWPSASQTRTTLKLDGVYRFANGYSALLGLDWERKKAPLPVNNTALFANQVFFRPSMDEYGPRAELRKALSETVNGSLSIDFKRRQGNNSEWVTASATGPTTLVSVDPNTANRVLPDMYMDRDRTKARATVEWSATEKLDLQAVYEHSQDNFKRAYSVNNLTPGAREMYLDSLSLDGSYTITDNWKLTAYLTESAYRWQVNKASLTDDTRNNSETFGLGVKGKMTGKLDVGGDFLHTTDTTSFYNMPLAGNIAGFAGQPYPGNYLPTIHYITDRVNLYANYALDKAADLRFDVTYQHFETDDWQWGYNGIPFLYSDNSTVSQPMSQNLIYVTARYAYRF